MKTHNRRDRAFTLTELLITLVAITFFSSVLIPRLAKAHSTASVFGAQCLNNQHQLAAAALMYADDNHDSWLPNYPGQTSNWISGNINFSLANTDNTNISIITNGNYSTIAPYLLKPQILHCPADPSYIVGVGRRVRSVSMNEAVGTVGTTTSPLIAGQAVNGQWLSGINIGNSLQTAWKTYGKSADMNRPTPAMLWIFTDEHPDSINDGQFAVQMAQTGIHSTIIDFPANYHSGAGGFSFADGHAELHQWSGQTIQPPVVNGGGMIGNNSSPAGDSSGDVAWLQLHTSARN